MLIAVHACVSYLLLVAAKAMSLLILSLFLLVQFTPEMDGAVVKQEKLHSEDDLRRFQRQQSQDCYDAAVADVAETDPICANSIEAFLSAAQSQLENFTVPQVVIDGICDSICYRILTTVVIMVLHLM